mgnify:FL=1|tara:strand:- start:78 stop:356 length:279 start_codon:yes stop_codon:yes gene_type:complete
MKHNRDVEFTFTFMSLEVSVVYTPKYFTTLDSRMDHIEFHVENDTPIPLTKTGYRSEFVYTDKDFTQEEIIEWFYKENGAEQGVVPLQTTLF